MSRQRSSNDGAETQETVFADNDADTEINSIPIRFRENRSRDKFDRRKKNWVSEEKLSETKMSKINQNLDNFDEGLYLEEGYREGL